MYIQAIYVLLQKRLIFNKLDCMLDSLTLSLSLSLSLSLLSTPFLSFPQPLSLHSINTITVMITDVLSLIVYIGRWRDYPVGVTAYSYTFGAMFMGIATIYFGATGQKSQFLIPQSVCCVLWWHNTTLYWLHVHMHKPCDLKKQCPCLFLFLHVCYSYKTLFGVHEMHGQMQVL